MKCKLQNQFLITLLWLFTTTAFSQQPLKKIDSMLVDVNKATLTTNILYERVVPLAQLNIFNDSLNVSNANHFEQALSELYRASKKQQFLSVAQFRAQYASKTNYNITDIGIINANFNQINYTVNEVNSSLKIVNNKFEKKQNALPEFIKKETLIISPLKKYVTSNSITYRFNNTFLIQNNTKTITSIIANFDTATDYTIYDNGSFTNTTIDITYPTTGEKILTFLVTFSDGSTKTTQAIIHTQLQSPTYTQAHRWDSSNAPNPNNFKWLGVNGALDYRIFYANNDGVYNRGYDLTTIQKPIIIIDGFDPLDKRKIEDTDPHDLSNDDHRSIVDLMEFKDNLGVTTYIIKKLNKKGYDVIIVNHPEYTKNGQDIDGGADYIERNGLIHASFYQEINKHLTNNGNYDNQIVIMGPSMGGLISRYALAYMEKKEAETGLATWNHNTRLWVSIDSPHLGANIPMGAQSLLYTLKNVAGSQGAIDYVNNELNSNAAKQLLIEQYKQNYISFFGHDIQISSGNLPTNYLDGRTISQGFSEDRGRPEFISFYDNLYNNGLPNSKGYPQNLTKIAMTNGSLTGSKNYKIGDHNGSFSNSGAQTIKIKGFADGLFHRGHIHITTLENYFMPNFGNSHKISYYKTKKAFGWNYTNTYISNINSRGTMDNVSGGLFAVNGLVESSITGQKPYEHIFGGDIGSALIGGALFGSVGLAIGAISDWGISVNDWSTHTLKSASSFIPTVSALGIKNPDFNWYNAIGNRDLVCTGETPFDSYYGDTVNTEHISFTENSFDWLKNWLDGNNMAPSIYNNLDSSDLIGENQICNGEHTYYFEDCKVLGNITWTTSQNMDIVASNNNSITVISNSISNAYWIRAEFEDGSVVFKRITGKPHFRVSIDYTDIFPILTITSIYTPLSEQNIINVSWYKTGGSGELDETSDYESLAVGSPMDTWNLNGYVRLTNSCGYTDVSFHVVHNPNNQRLEIVYLGNNIYKIKDLITNEIQTINNAKLYNAYGIEEQNINNQNNEIELQNVQSGKVKIIKVVVGNKVLIKRIITD